LKEFEWDFSESYMDLVRQMTCMITSFVFRQKTLKTHKNGR